ncbi:MAG: VCBS repeat-containing protein [Flavobacteriia bacterium]|nr:VCBS repeat-containing protein [Flavobacteriia bacterium]
MNWIDYNGDGLNDLFLTNGPSTGQNNMLFKNNGNGTFLLVSNDPIVSDNMPSDGATWADMDNDGDPDCFVANWYNQNNMLYANNGNGTFTKLNISDATTDAGYSETASWGDLDKDGFVDLLVTNSSGNKNNFLYYNNGNVTFTKFSSGSIVTDASESRCINWCDVDNDGFQDAFVTNESG